MGACNIKFKCVLVALKRVECFAAAHPDVPIFTVAADERLNDPSYILPGLGDADDCAYGGKQQKAVYTA